MKFGLRGSLALNAEFGNPYRSFPSIHIAGSNGKGSTAAMVAAILQSAGYRTGLYTSPHLIDFCERIRINGKMIGKRDLVRLTNEISGTVRRVGATFFEVTTAIAFKYFAEQKVDIAVVETGLGGRLDATNIITPLLTIITTISLEHTQILGTHLSDIAYEKSGIIKSKVPCVTGVQSSTALAVIRSTCKKKRSALINVNVHHQERKKSLRGTHTDIIVNGTSLRNVFISLPGLIQIRNSALAIVSTKALSSNGHFKITDGNIRDGLGNIQTLTGIQSRMSIIKNNPVVIADVAHNPEAIKRQVETLNGLKINDVVLVFGIMKDKDIRSVAKLIKPIASKVVLVSAKTDRSLSTKEMVPFFKRKYVDVIETKSVAEGVRKAEALAGKKGTVLITGSHFVVAEALAFLKRKKYLTINQ